MTGDLFAGTAAGQAVAVNVKTQRCSLYCGRAMPAQGFPDASPFANPFKLAKGHTDRDRAVAILNYEAALLDNPVLILRLIECRGHSLGCWCKPLACHCDVLARWANSSSKTIMEAHFRARRTFGGKSDPQKGEAEWLRFCQLHQILPAELGNWRRMMEAEAAAALEALWKAHQPVFASPLVRLRAVA